MPPCNWKCWLMGFIVGLLLGWGACKIGLPGGTKPTPAPAGMVWTDNEPQNCAKESTEVGIPGITVELRSGSNVISTAVTDANGNYAFPSASVPAGTYSVVIPTPPGTPVCDTDSDPGPGDHTVIVVVPASGNGPVADFGYQ